MLQLEKKSKDSPPYPHGMRYRTALYSTRLCVTWHRRTMTSRVSLRR